MNILYHIFLHFYSTFLKKSYIKRIFLTKTKANIALGDSVLADFSRYCSETRISGRVAIGSPSALIGRIRFFDESYTEGSILCIRGDERIDKKMLLLCPPLAVIVFCDESAISLGEICSLGVPCVVFNNSDVRYENCKNKVSGG